MRPFTLLFVATILLATTSVGPANAEIRSYAIVRDDGTLIVRGQIVRLYGVLIPSTGRFCQQNIRPGRCRSSAAALALDGKIQGFVRCEPVEQYGDGSIGAFCSVGSIRLGDSEDLGGYLITRGHAFAAPEAPYEYVILQELAKVNRRGLWGFGLGAWY